MLWKKAVFVHQKTVQNIIHANIRNICISKVLRKDHYETLGVKRDATLSEIKNAYFELSKIYHPDRIAATDDNLAKFREISTAYEILGNEHSRKMYDRGLFGEDSVGAEAEHTEDPIIRFYRERHQRGKMQAFGKSEDDLDAWTQKYYKEARKTTVRGADIFQASKYKEKEIEDPIISILHILAIWTVIIFYITSNIENHPVQKKYEFFKNLLKNKLN